MQNEHTDEQQDKGRAKAPPQIGLGKSGDNVTDEAAKSHDARITQLCRDVFDMITSGTGTGENGRIRNGGAMITEHAASEGCGKGNHHEIRIDGLSHRDDDRDQDAEGPPCRARGEAQKACNQKHDGGEERPGYASVRHKGLHENRRLEKIAADTADRPCQHQNDVGGQHGLHAFNGPVHKCPERQKAARNKKQEGNGKGSDGCPNKRLGGRTVAEGRAHGVERRILAPVTAAIEEAEYGKNDQAADGEQHIPYGPTFRRLNLLLGTSINGAKITVLSAFLSCAHGAEIRIGQADKAHHSDGEQGVEVIGDSGNKRGKIAGERPGCPEVASHRGGPAGNRRDDADGRGSGINDIGQLGARNFVGIGDRFHNRTDGKAIEIVIDENERTQTAGGQQGGLSALDPARGPFPVRSRPTRHGNGVDQSPKQRTENQDVEVDLVGHSVKGRFNGSHEQDITIHPGGINERSRQ